MKKVKDITQLHSELLNKTLDGKKLLSDTLTKADIFNDKYNLFVTICHDTEYKGVNDNILSGIPCAIKDNFSTKGILSTGSSNTLKDYTPFFDATVVEKLKANDAIIIGKTVLDELGMGGTGTTGHTGPTKNPWNTNRICGGSSSGSACAVASGLVPYALGSDTGDSIRKPAALCGIVGYKPTYGMISRYGLYPFACSLDHVGVLTRSVKDAAIVTDAIKGIDEKDMTTWDSTDINLVDGLTKDVKNQKLFYIKELCDINSYKNPNDELIETLKIFKDTIDIARKNKIKVYEESFDMKLLKAIYPTYICISCAEATSNYSNLTGIVFGPRGQGKTIDDVMIDHRTKGFCTLIKRRFIIGSYVLQKENQEKYFKNAQRVRRMIVNELNKLFEQYDGLILPCSASGARKFDQVDDIISPDISLLENHLALGNFGGFPSITIPNGFVNGLPIGINITGKIKDDINILNIAYKIEQSMNFYNMSSEKEEL